MNGDNGDNGDVPTLGQKYSLSCCVSGADLLWPIITYQWLHNGETLDERTSTLSFPSLGISDKGKYTCHVTVRSALLKNPINEISKTYTLSKPSE